MNTWDAPSCVWKGASEAQDCGAVFLTTVVQQSVKVNASSLLVIKWGITAVPDFNRLKS